jgi:RNA polymerase sigma-70 factor (ECF subfamily)
MSLGQKAAGATCDNAARVRSIDIKGGSAVVRNDNSEVGPREQVAQLYVEAREDVYRYLLSFGLPPFRAQELTQDSFLRLYESMSQGGAISQPRAWLFRTAHNLGSNARSRERTFAALDETAYSALRDGSPGPEDAVIDRQRMLRISHAMGDLSHQQRQVLELRASGLRYREIAETLGVSISTVYEFLNRALRRLKGAADE